MEGKKAIVTGVAGFIGSTLADRLLLDGWTVVGVDSFEDYYPRAYKEHNVRQASGHPAFTLIERNILDLAVDGTLSALMEGAGVVYHLAAQAGVRTSWGSGFRVYSDNNVLGTQLVLEAAHRAGVRKVVYASSSSVYGDTDVLPMRENAVCRPHSPYGVTKLAGEHLCGLYYANFGLNTVSLRFFTVYGPRQRPDMAFHRFIRTALDGGRIAVYGDGLQSRDFTYIDDIVDGIIASVSAPPGSVLNLGGGSRVTVRQVVAALEEVTGVQIAVDYIESQAGDVSHTAASLESAHDLIGYTPRVLLYEGLRREADWLRGLPGEPRVQG